jgi:ferritin-like metal-binding protein YciE
MDIEEQFIAWLKDAYFMETNYAKALEEHLGPAKDYPRLHRLIDEHLWATTSHAYEVGLCLERLNWNVKDLSYDRSPLHPPFEQSAANRQDTVINNLIVELTTEHYEIARYIGLITAATNVGDLVTVEVCEAILEDEEAMAEKLTVELPEITSTYLELLFLSERRKFIASNQSEFRPTRALTRFTPIAAWSSRETATNDDPLGNSSLPVLPRAQAQHLSGQLQASKLQVPFDG